MVMLSVISWPISYFKLKARIGWQATLGMALAIAGVAILFLA